jgi:hypothetical protein
VKSVPELEKILFAGMKNRKVGKTAMNAESSRSHSIFTIYIEQAENVILYLNLIGCHWKAKDQSRKIESGGLGRFREVEQDGSNRNQTGGGKEHQSFSLSRRYF